MDVINALLNTFVVVLIVSTMFAAGLGTTLGALGATFRNVKLVLLVLVANLVLVPLIGWGTAAVARRWPPRPMLRSFCWHAHRALRLPRSWP